MDRDHALSVLRRLRPDLEARGVCHAGLFGSLSRGSATIQSDVDIVVTLEAGRRFDLIDLGGIQELLDRGFERMDVDLVFEPIKRADLKAEIARDRVDAF